MSQSSSPTPPQSLLKNPAAIQSLLEEPRPKSAGDVRDMSPLYYALEDEAVDKCDQGHGDDSDTDSLKDEKTDSATNMRPKRSFSFLRERAGSFSKIREKNRGKRLSGSSLNVPPSFGASPSRFFLSTPLACVPLGAYVAESHREPSLSRTLSLRQVKKRLFPKNSESDPGRPPPASVGGSRSLDALVVVDGSEGKKVRGVSLRRLSRQRHDHITSDSNASHSDTEICPPAIHVSDGAASGTASEASLELSRVGAWAASFEKLIEDPAGLHTFAEFLKKEYSHENIYFWTACERYKCLAEASERLAAASAIFERHLGASAQEPVNVDSHARQVAKDGLANPSQHIFTQAQKQIFNLMKFDSYSRFLKSDLYNKCSSQERKGLPLPYPGDHTLDPDLEIFSENPFAKHLKKSKSDAEERRRKSLLPWHRKDRSKSKDRGESDYWRRRKEGRMPSESSNCLSDSRTSLSSASESTSSVGIGGRALSKESLTSGDAVSLSGVDGAALCRVLLPDRSNSVLAVRSGETVREMIRQLLDRRRIHFTDFNVFYSKNNKSVDLEKDCTAMGGHEVRLERMTLFSLHLPSRKTVIVKAKPHKVIGDVLKPILTKYGLKLDLMVIHKLGDSKGVNIKSTVTELDGEKLIVRTKEEVKEWIEPGRPWHRNATLDEITNRVFEDLLSGKGGSSFDDLGVLDVDVRSNKTDPTSDSSSSLLGNFNRRESLSLERNLASRGSGGVGRGALGDSFMTPARRETHAPNFHAKTKQENADLYEGLKRAQMCRLDDQRGTEINFELPDFLKSDRCQESNITS